MFLSFLTDLFQQDFMLRALAAGFMLGILAPLLGSIVVVRRLSFIADTLGHFSLVGISVSLFLSSIGFSYFFEKPLYLGIIFSVIGGLLIEFFRRSYKNYKEISMVIVISLGAALSAIFFALASKTGSLYEYLFGSINVFAEDMNLSANAINTYFRNCLDVYELNKNATVISDKARNTVGWKFEVLRYPKDQSPARFKV